jgi:hypothetical protein
MKALFDADPITKTKRIFHYDHTDDSFTIETLQDVEEIAELNKASFNRADPRWKGDFHRVASIPMPIFMQLQMQGIADDPVAFKRWLNDSDQRVFRTRPGRV